jgi:hypothetical protein
VTEIERREASVPAPASQGDGPARPVQYGGEWVSDPTWVHVRPEVAQAALRNLGRPIDAAWASFIPPQRVKRATADGSTYRQQLAWCVGPTGVTLIDARQGGALQQRRFLPHGEWACHVQHRTFADVGVKLIRATMPAPTLIDDAPSEAASPGGAVSVSGPFGDGYGGKFPAVWTNLPFRVRRALQQAVPYGPSVVEEASALLYFGRDGVQEQFWYERRGAGTLAAAYTQRANRTVAVATADDAPRWVSGLPWDVVAVQIDDANVVWPAAMQGSRHAALGGQQPDAGR